MLQLLALAFTVDVPKQSISTTQVQSSYARETPYSDTPVAASI